MVLVQGTREPGLIIDTSLMVLGPWEWPELGQYETGQLESAIESHIIQSGRA